MKHAYLIIAHNEWFVLNTLLSMIDDERNDVYLHIDAKVKELPQLYTCKKAGYKLLEKRIDVRWGGLSQVRTEMLLFSEAHANGPYAYYHLLSGVDLPIKTQDYIHDFCDENQGKEFIGFFQGEYHEADTKRKVSLRYLFTGYNKRCPFLPKWKIALAQLVRHSCLSIQKLIGYRRLDDCEFKKGHQWVSITNDAVELLLSQHEWIMRRFCQVNTPDEIYKQTVIWNSPLRDNLYNINDDKKGCMRFIDWERGEPYTWQDCDIEELLSSEFLFARKMSGTNKTLSHKLVANN